MWPMQIGDHATELAEVLAEVLDRIAAMETRAAARDAGYEQRISRLEERAAANRALICQCEEAFRALGALSKTWVAETDRFSSG